jgi:predicted NBD/HSP70 family sugar kinase
VAITNGELKVLSHAGEAADVKEGPDAVLGIALDLPAKLRSEEFAAEIHGVGVGLPGPVSVKDGIPIAPPIMPGWDGYQVRSVLSQHLGAPVLSTTT